MSSICIISQSLPSLPSEPGSPRLYHFAKEWSRHHELLLVVIGEAQSVPQELSNIFTHIFFLPKPNSFSMSGRLKHRICNAPYFYLGHRDPKAVAEIRASIARILEKYEVKRLHVNLISNAEFVPLSYPKEQVSVDVRDALALIYQQKAAMSARLFEKVDLLLEARSSNKYLTRLSKRGYLLSMVATADADYVGRHLQIETCVIPNGVDSDYFDQRLFGEPQLGEYWGSNKAHPLVVFTGVMDYFPNVETAQHFAQDIFPVLRERHPSLEFKIVGATPSPVVEALGQLPGVTVTGRVPDVRPYLASADVFVCPMRSGAGIKNKILSAMAAGLPVVASSLGVAGITVEDGRHCFIREDSPGFIECVDAILNKRIDVSEMRRQARLLVEQKYRWRVFAEAMLAQWGLAPRFHPEGFDAEGFDAQVETLNEAQGLETFALKTATLGATMSSMIPGSSLIADAINETGVTLDAVDSLLSSEKFPVGA